jgi:hypothetical protein
MFVYLVQNEIYCEHIDDNLCRKYKQLLKEENEYGLKMDLYVDVAYGLLIQRNETFYIYSRGDNTRINMHFYAKQTFNVGVWICGLFYWICVTFFHHSGFVSYWIFSCVFFLLGIDSGRAGSGSCFDFGSGFARFARSGSGLGFHLSFLKNASYHSYQSYRFYLYLRLVVSINRQ